MTAGSGVGAGEDQSKMPGQGELTQQPLAQASGGAVAASPAPAVADPPAASSVPAAPPPPAAAGAATAAPASPFPPLAPPSRADGGLLTGALALPRALGTIVANPRLWPFAAAPIIIAAFAFGLGTALGIWLVHTFASGWFTSWTGWFWGAIAWVAEILLDITVFIAAIVAAKTVVLPIVAGPFNEMLSEQVEYIHTGTKPPSTSFRQLLDDALPAAWRGVSTALFGLMILVIFLPLLLIPGIGVVLYLLPTAYVEALSALDVTFARKKLSLGEKRAWMEARRASAVGLGAAILLGNLIPLGALVVVPSAAVAGTLLVLGERKR